MECNKKTDAKTRNYYRNASLQRIAILCGVLSLVVVIVYLTPMPEKYFLNCDRPCHELDWPMICRIKLTMEVYKTLSKACGDCPGNSSECGNSHCISADGYQRGILAANRLLPGPSIQVCVNDILVVDVVNRVPGQGLAIHWRGQPQKETPFMDGVPMVTQCPIPSYTTFQYKFRASQPGTHMYHAHSGAEAADGILGALVVREPDKLEPMRRLYDKDEASHVIVVSEWTHSFAIQNLLDLHPARVQSLLINGKGFNVGHETDKTMFSVFKVISGLRYRFRIAYAGGVKGCPITVRIDRHVLQLIALDGHPVVPREVSSITLGRGERADFVLNANQPPGQYWINLATGSDCNQKIASVALLRYEGAKSAVTNEETSDDSDSNIGVFNSATSDQCDGDQNVCVSDVQSLEMLPEELRAEKMDTTLYLPYHHHRHKSLSQFDTSSGMDGVHFTFPTSPLLTQEADVPHESICDARVDDSSGTPAKNECVHIKEIPLGNTVEIVLFDQGGENNQVFHLHGYSFYVVGIRQFNDTLQPKTVKEMNAQGTLFPQKNLLNPVRKDTIIIPKFGAAALRFKADNPGYWMLRDEGSSHWTRGIDVVLKVGNSGDSVQAPVDFPKCGDYIGPEYFLI